jgi:hypothetical protein
MGRRKPEPEMSQSTCGGWCAGWSKWPIASRWSARTAASTRPYTCERVGTMPSHAVGPGSAP